jgi:hypothetical protein
MDLPLFPSAKIASAAFASGVPQRWPTRPAATVRRAGKLLRVLAHHLLDGRQAISRLGKSGRHVAVVVFAMALLSFADSSP